MNGKVRREIKILKLFKHPNIIRLYEIIKTPSTIILSMEYVPNGDLYKLLESKGKLQESEARKYFQQIVEALDYIHSNKVSHRDIKPENLLLDSDMNIKVADFGLSNLMRDGVPLETACGSPNYAAPELLSGCGYCGNAVDVWSTGVVLFALVAGYLPFDDNNIQELFNKIRRTEYQVPRDFSPYLKDLVMRMLHPEPFGRITLEEVKAHPWFKANLPVYKVLKSKDAAELQSYSQNTQHNFEKGVLNECLNLPEFSNINKPREELIDRINKHKEDTFTVTYELMLNQTLKQKRKSIEQEYSGNCSTSASEEPSCKSSEGSVCKKTENKPNDWVCGLRFSEDSESLMCQLFECLKRHHLEWKLNDSDFSFKVREKDWKQGMLKFQIKIYMEENQYAIDLKWIEGNCMKFLDFTSKILLDFRNASNV